MRATLRRAGIIASTLAITVAPPALAESSSETAGSGELVINRDFPDPDILQANGTQYAFATNSGGTNVQVATAETTSGPWQQQADALPRPPSWIGPDKRGLKNIWAPNVTPLPDGGYGLYFSGFNPRLGRECLGAATSDQPGGPYTPTSQQPLLCARGEVIDPYTFVDDDGSRYLLYKREVGDTATIRMRAIGDDGITPNGREVELLRADRPEENGVIEGPTLVHRPEGYVLFFSANGFKSGHYFVNYATSPNLAGPFAKAPGSLLSGSNPGDPGGQDVLEDQVVFHGDLGRPGGPRGMFETALHWNGINPVLG